MAQAQLSPLYDGALRALDKAGLLRPAPEAIPPRFNLFTVAETVASYVEQTKDKDDLDHMALRLYDRTTIVQTMLKKWCDIHHAKESELVQQQAVGMER